MERPISPQPSAWTPTCRDRSPPERLTPLGPSHEPRHPPEISGVRHHDQDHPPWMFDSRLHGNIESMPSKVLAVVSEPVSGEALKDAIGRTRAEVADVLVVAPALNTRTRFLLSDVDPAIQRAEEVMEETVDRMDEEGINAAGDTGESDPLLAIQDALQTFPADRIVLFIHSEADRNWLEEGVVEEARERFEVPVEHVLVERS